MPSMRMCLLVLIFWEGSTIVECSGQKSAADLTLNKEAEATKRLVLKGKEKDGPVT